MTKISLVIKGGWPLPWLSYCIASFTLLSNPSTHAAFVAWRPGLLIPDGPCAHGILRVAELHFLLSSVPFLGPFYHQSGPWEFSGTSVSGTVLW